MVANVTRISQLRAAARVPPQPLTLTFNAAHHTTPPSLPPSSPSIKHIKIPVNRPPITARNPFGPLKTNVGRRHECAPRRRLAICNVLQERVSLVGEQFYRTISPF